MIYHVHTETRQILNFLFDMLYFLEYTRGKQWEDMRWINCIHRIIVVFSLQISSKIQIKAQGLF